MQKPSYLGVSNDVDPNNNLGIQRFSHLEIPTKYQYLTDFTNLVPVGRLFDSIIDVAYWYHAFTYIPAQHWNFRHGANHILHTSLGVHVQKLDLEREMPTWPGGANCLQVNFNPSESDNFMSFRGEFNKSYHRKFKCTVWTVTRPYYVVYHFVLCFSEVWFERNLENHQSDFTSSQVELLDCFVVSVWHHFNVQVLLTRGC